MVRWLRGCRLTACRDVSIVPRQVLSYILRNIVLIIINVDSQGIMKEVKRERMKYKFLIFCMGIVVAMLGNGKVSYQEEGED